MTHLPHRPLLSDLLRVIGIGQTQEYEGLRLSLLALEVYADGCILTVLLQRDQPIQEHDDEDIHRRIPILGEVAVTMADDCGGEYTGAMAERGSSSQPGFWKGRGQFPCTPTLDPAAQELRIEIPAVTWQYME
ncbi:MAG TPA: hypothetical protein VJR48_03850, partial [Ktedonobacterales bacterium]|nr:hypothetical protein [Ktedonobacterales bacterium]